MLVSGSFARRFFPNQDPIGRYVTYSTVPVTCEIIGDVRAGEEFYIPHTQHPWLTMTLALRTARDLRAVARAAEIEIHRVDPQQPVARIYSVMTYTLALRSREMAIRLALGSTPQHLYALVIRQSSALALAGLALGIPASVAAGRLCSGLLFGIQPYDPLTIVAVIVGVGSAALLAGYARARRAVNADALRALQSQ